MKVIEILQKLKKRMNITQKIEQHQEKKTILNDFRTFKKKKTNANREVTSNNDILKRKINNILEITDNLFIPKNIIRTLQWH